MTNKTDNSLPRGRSLENDFGRLIDDERFHDIALKCSDGKMVHGCIAILATRSSVFSSSIFSKPTRNTFLSYDDINSIAMKVILEFLYTSKVKKENLTADNVIEVYYASVHFGLTSLNDHIINFVKSLANGNVDVGKKLLSEYVEKFTSEEAEHEMSLMLVLWLSKNKLEKNKPDSLSLKGLKYLLENTYSDFPFATPEFNIWEYTLTKVIRTVIQEETTIKRVLNQKSLSMCNTQEIRRIKSHLSSLIDYINLKRMDVKEIEVDVEPFGIYSTEKIKDAYHSIASNEELGCIRGVPIFKWKYKSEFKWKNDESDIVTNEGSYKSILGDFIFKGRGVYGWNISIEKMCKTIYIGICGINENLNKIDQKYHGWVLGSDGYAYHNNKWKWYDAKFKEGDVVTVQLNMRMKTCAFSINDGKKFTVSEWEDIPSQVYPIASFGYGSRLRLLDAGEMIEETMRFFVELLINIFKQKKIKHFKN